MFVSRAKAVQSVMSLRGEAKRAEEADKRKVPKMEECVAKRDYVGAMTLLEFQKNAGKADQTTLPWLAFSAFHLGDYKKALDVYNELLSKSDADPTYHLYKACCLYFLGLYAEAKAEAAEGPTTRLQNRIFYHLAHKMDDRQALVEANGKLTTSVEDVISKAAMHYNRSQFQEAADIYKRIYMENRHYTALHVYVALCYFKLDFHEDSNNILAPYLKEHKDSAFAINLKACNDFKLYDGNAAEQEVKGMLDLIQSTSQDVESDLIRHNLVVFREGENALQVLPPLVDIIPEARLNLVIYYLHAGDFEEAHKLIDDVTPQTPHDYILKAVANVALGQQNDSPEHIELAKNFFKTVGDSESECDTIHGRQCMASKFLLEQSWEDVLLYLSSIQAYSYNDDAFHMNYAIVLGSTGKYREAEESLLQVQSGAICSDYMYISWLARCFIMNEKPQDAWELYLKMEAADSLNLLILIANDCYRMGSFYYAAKAFDVLERLDPNPEYWEGKRGACCGVFQKVLAGKARKERLRDVINMLQSNAVTPQAELMVRIMSKWAEENGINVTGLQ